MGQDDVLRRILGYAAEPEMSEEDKLIQEAQNSPVRPEFQYLLEKAKASEGPPTGASAFLGRRSPEQIAQSQIDEIDALNENPEKFSPFSAASIKKPLEGFNASSRMPAGSGGQDWEGSVGVHPPTIPPFIPAPSAMPSPMGDSILERSGDTSRHLKFEDAMKAVNKPGMGGGSAGSPSKAVLATPSTAPKAKSDDGYGEDLSDLALKAALERQQNNAFITNLGRAANQITAGVTHTKAQNDVLDSIDKAAGMEVAGIKERRKGKDEEITRGLNMLKMASEKELEDPNSPVSQFAYNMAKALAPKLNLTIPDKPMSAGQLKRAGIDLDSMITKINTSEMLAETKKGNEALRQAQFTATQNQRNISNIQRYQDAFNKDKLVVKANEGLQSANDAEALLDSNTPISDQAVRRSLARLSGEVGVLTDQDVAAFGGSKSIKDRLGQALQQMYDGKLTETNKNYMRSLIKVFKDRREKQILERTKFFAEQGSKRLGVPKEDTADYLLPGQNVFEKAVEAPKKSNDDRVPVKDPHGRIRLIPRSQLKDALDAGGEQI